ncbi:hypothetical protein BDV96DRAFT_655830 [Lophiotrema nucula]|uniref:Uncharacterized protein n=1 Tax=Lophiotrema nucula TaxID=690887 RepID=A0A6A5YDQ4_9PLEO|nr:hypothetical protein BDV96DRAFT_655830 [Lophiotrema nucula]
MAHSKESEILISLVQHPNQGVEHAIQAIVKISRDAAAADLTSGAGLVFRSKLDSHVHAFCTALVDLASRTSPVKQDILAQFVRQIQTITVVSDLHGEGRVWADLPKFGYTAYDNWNIDLRSTNLPLATQIMWENLTAFYAQLTSVAGIDHGISEGHCAIDGSFLALVTFREAFENERCPSPMLLRGACLWFIYACNVLWANVTNRRSFPDRAGLGGNKTKYGKQWKGYNVERWYLWERALRSVDVASEGTPTMTMSLVSKALDNMRNVTDDRSYTGVSWDEASMQQVCNR